VSATNDEKYLTALGRAVFRFALLEYRVIWILEKPSPGYINSYRASRKAASAIAKDLKIGTDNLRPSKPDLANEMDAFHDEFDALGKARNNLLHANPATAPGGDQVLIRQHFEAYIVWDLAAIESATAQFDAAQGRGAKIFDALP
jgi:hypothetical protein